MNVLLKKSKKAGFIEADICTIPPYSPTVSMSKERKHVILLLIRGSAIDLPALGAGRLSISTVDTRFRISESVDAISTSSPPLGWNETG